MKRKSTGNLRGETDPFKPVESQMVSSGFLASRALRLCCDRYAAASAERMSSPYQSQVQARLHLFALRNSVLGGSL